MFQLIISGRACAQPLTASKKGRESEERRRGKEGRKEEDKEWRKSSKKEGGREESNRKEISPSWS